MLPLTKVEVWQLRLFGSWESQLKILLLRKILWGVIREVSLNKVPWGAAFEKASGKRTPHFSLRKKMTYFLWIRKGLLL
jgi:hypothetical protein